MSLPDWTSRPFQYYGVSHSLCWMKSVVHPPTGQVSGWQIQFW